MEQTTLQKVLSMGFLVAILAICVILLIIAINSQEQRINIQEGNDKIFCVLLVNPDERVLPNGQLTEKVKGCKI